MGKWEPIKDWAEASTVPCVGLPCRRWAVCVSVCVCLCVGAHVCEFIAHCTLNRGLYSRPPVVTWTPA